MSSSPSLRVEFDCEGCGTHVVIFGVSAPRESGFCATCAWLCEFVRDPEDMMRLRAWLKLLEPEPNKHQ
jgi:hypothetical protein